MALGSAEKYQREVADAFVNGSTYYGGCCGFVRTKCNCDYIWKPVVEYVESTTPVVSRSNKELCITYVKGDDSGIIRCRVNAILKRYGLGEIKREKCKWVYYDKEGEIIPRKEGHTLRRDKKQKEKYLIFDIKTIEFTFLNI